MKDSNSKQASTQSNQERCISFVEEECNLENGDIENFRRACKQGKIWNENSTKMLIALCKKFIDQFETGVQKHVWKKLSLELTKKCQRIYTYQQCDTKFKVLKNMYKSVRKYNSQSGNNKKGWEYYGLMGDIMFNKPQICPVATCSSARGLITNGLQEQDTNIEVSRPSG
ncbi:unnamed protein product [Psylliodes chrysocephalus]|uniref:Myb/SANT-like DNA-binding domain-containing protein n=1 Tax=Psylliodes chrysocephalus TaxID=3402493 RepID=A0A9P0GBT1_9CUCU|nr:unnamed protein product [Psylliodes chrysocephala]